MDHEKALARDNLGALEAEIKMLTEQVGQRDAALAAAPGEGDSPAGYPAALAADGKAYRQHLRAEVKRLAGILKSEAEASLLLAALPHAPAAALAELVDSYRARVEEKFPPRGVGELAAPGASLSPGDPRPAPAGPERPFRFS